MILRYARHTLDLEIIEKFYSRVVGLEKIGEFKNHDNYNGLFMGYTNSNWHLEFTTSLEKPESKFDEDDKLVFYVSSEAELASIKKTIIRESITIEIPKNPYWLNNGIMISDPDGFRIVFSIKHLKFNSIDGLTSMVKSKSINNWSDLIEHIRNLPYGRNENRHDYSLVLKENKGTCSSKHALLMQIAELNNFKNVQLILGIYKMNHINTPGIEKTILENGLEYLPEAHCYLMVNNRRIDLTNRNSEIENLTNDILKEIEIKPEQVVNFKVEYHKNYLMNWINEKGIEMNFDQVWELREKCISKLEVE
jgi:hypothetical protein